MACLKQILIGIDQLANTLVCGMADETLSARAYRTELDGKRWGKIFRPIIDALFFFEKRHCWNSYLAEYERKQLPSHYRN